jgi:hypothetical protein
MVVWWSGWRNSEGHLLAAALAAAARAIDLAGRRGLSRGLDSKELHVALMIGRERRHNEGLDSDSYTWH